MDQENKTQTEYYEINLMDYVKVIIKRKQMIFGVLLVVLIAVAVYSFFICPKVYKIDTLIKIGKIGGTLIEEPGQLLEEIKAGAYNFPIIEKLNLSEGIIPKIKIESPAGTDLLIIKTESSTPEIDKTILEELNNLILIEHSKKFETRKELVKKDIERLKNKTALLEEEKINLEKKEKSLEWLSPYERVKEQFTGSLFTLYDVKEKLSARKQEIENLYREINSLEGSLLENIQPTKVLKSPTISEKPIKPRPVLNIVIGAVLGIFLGVFFAFGKEWWEKNRV